MIASSIWRRCGSVQKVLSFIDGFANVYIYMYVCMYVGMYLKFIHVDKVVPDLERILEKHKRCRTPPPHA